MFLPVLRSYSCEVVRQKGITLSLAYGWHIYQEAELAGLRSEVLSAAGLGLLNQSPPAVRSFADRIRQCKRADPILGAVAALAYANIGDRDGASSVRDYMRGDLGADLFDVWMLAGGGESRYPVVPAVPLLSQSWSLLDAFPVTLPERLRLLPRVPGFWTVFEAGAFEEACEIVFGEQGGE